MGSCLAGAFCVVAAMRHDISTTRLADKSMRRWSHTMCINNWVLTGAPAAERPHMAGASAGQPRQPPVLQQIRPLVGPRAQCACQPH
jgi:hypothetical protein